MVDSFKNGSADFIHFCCLLTNWLPRQHGMVIFLSTLHKLVTMATRNGLFPIFELQNFTDTYLGKVTSFNLITLAISGVAFKKSD